MEESRLGGKIAMQGFIPGTYKILQSLVPESIRVPGYFLETLDTQFWIDFFRILIVLSAAAAIGGFIYLSSHSHGRRAAKGNSDMVDKEEE